MSNKRKHKRTQSRKPNQKKKQSVGISKKKAPTFFEKIKTFFVGMFSNINISDLKPQLLKHLKQNRNAYMFFTAMVLIVTVGYFTIVYETDDEKRARLQSDVLDVTLENEYTAVEDQLADIQDPEDEVVVSLADIDETPEVDASVNEESKADENTLNLVEDGVLEEATLDDQLGEMDTEDVLVADPVERITAASLLAASESEVMKAEPAFASVKQSMMLGIDAYALMVDDHPIAYFETEGEAHLVLKHLKEGYMQADAVDERIIFQEEIRVEKTKIDVLAFEGFKTQDEALEFIKKGTNESRFHTVQKNENFWVIAPKYGLSYLDLEEANPDINPKRLQIGQEISLIVPKPLINVVTITTFERLDPIPFGKEDNVPTEKYYVGEYRVKRSGVPGEAMNVVEQYSVNGRVIGEKTLSSEVLKEPIAQIMWAGTKPAPPRQGTGTFQNPTSRGYITSYFGARSLGYHNGIDIGIPMYTDVKAADGGTVLFAGYKGTYGKLVIINHGENKHSYYAHNSSLKVSAGEKVYKGQLIALSGNTGRSTGPHLHFEVRINGTPVNPIRMVNY